MWFLKFIKADLEGYLQSLNAPPETIQWILQQPEDVRQHYINEFRKNQPPLDQLQRIPVPQQKSPYTGKEIQRTEDFDQPFQSWALIQLRKHRTKPNPILGGTVGGRRIQVMDYEYEPSIMVIDRQLDLIYDWWRQSDPQPEIASFNLEQANEAQEEWHEQMASEGEGLFYEATNPDNIVYKPEHWNGWNIQRVEGENDLYVEGNLMNHCVGGYCRDVEYGRTKIFSLRDPKNQPHVTIEIDRDWDIRQIQGNSNSDPKDEYKKMLAEWFQELQQEQPGLRLYYDEPYEFDFSNVYNSDIDEAIYQALDEPNEYGLAAPLDELDIEVAYENAMRELTRNNQHDLRYVHHIGKAIAYAAWQADKYRAKHTDWEHPDKDFNQYDSVKSFYRETKQLGIQWLQEKIQENEKYVENWRYDPPFSREEFEKEHAGEYETEEELEEAYLNAVQTYEDEAMNEYVGNSLPYALDQEIISELNRLAKEDPFLKEHHEAIKRTQEKAANIAQMPVAQNWVQKSLLN